MSTTAANFSQLPAEIVGLIAEEAAERDEYEEPTSLCTVSRLSQTSKSIRRACLPALLSYMFVQKASAPALLKWLHRDPYAARLIRTVDLDCWSSSGPSSIVSSRWWREAAISAIALEKECPTPSANSPVYHILGDLLVSILKRTCNMRALENVDLTYKLEPWTEGQLKGVALQALHLGPLKFLSGEYGGGQPCPAMRIFRLFEGGTLPPSLKSLTVSHHCRVGNVCLWYSPQRERWLSQFGSALETFTLNLAKGELKSLNPSDPHALTNMLNGMQSLRNLRVHMHAFDSKSDGTWASLASAIVSATHLPSHLVSLQLDVHRAHEPQSDLAGSLLLSQLAGFTQLRHLSVPFPHIPADTPDIVVRLPPTIKSLTFAGMGTAWGHSWAEWVKDVCSPAAMLPLMALSIAIREGKTPGTLASIILGLDVDGFNDKPDFRDRVARWPRELVLLLKEALVELHKSCRDRGIQFLTKPPGYPGPNIAVEDTLSFLDASEEVWAERRSLQEPSPEDGSAGDGE